MIKKEAWELFELEEDAPIDKIKKRYNVFLKKHKLGELTDADMEHISQAYHLLMDYEIKPTEEEIKKSDTTKKVEHFFFYYKLHIVAVLFVIALVGSFVYSLVVNGGPTFRVTFVGDFYMEKPDKRLDNKILQILKDYRHVTVDIINIKQAEENGQDYAFRAKLAASLYAGGFDLIITDQQYFEELAQKGSFLSLDSYNSQIDMDKNKVYVRKVLKDKKEHLYGIDLTESPTLKGMGYEGKPMIVSVFTNSVNKKAALSLLNKMLETK